MSNEIQKTQYLGILGIKYQTKLLGELFVPNNKNEETGNLFFDEVIELLDPKYFETLEMRRIMMITKEYYQKTKNSPNIDNIESIINSTINNDIEKRECLQRINNIKELWKKYKNGSVTNDRSYIKDQALRFVKQQEFLKANKESEDALAGGIITSEELFKISDKYKKIIDIGSPMNYGIDIFDRPDQILKEDYRDPIGTGIKEIDDKIEGGLSHGEFALILAGQGIGKTPFLTLIANNAYQNGKNVLHVLLEGKRDDVRRKHYARLFNVPINQLHLHKEKILNGIQDLTTNTKIGNLRVERLPDNTTPNKFKKWVLKTEDKLGYKFDVICMDYIDCLEPDERYSSPFFGQEEVAKKMESMTEELGWRLYAGIQAKKEANDKRILDMSDCGGAVGRIKKAQLVISLGADKAQKTSDKINVAINKCRFAKSGWIWEDCIFDNSVLNFSVNEVVDLDEGIGEESIAKAEYEKSKQNNYSNPNSNNNKTKVNNVTV